MTDLLIAGESRTARPELLAQAGNKGHLLKSITMQTFIIDVFQFAIIFGSVAISGHLTTRVIRYCTTRLAIDKEFRKHNP